MEHNGEVSGRNDILGLTPLERFAFAAIGLVLVVSSGVLAAAHLAAHSSCKPKQETWRLWRPGAAGYQVELSDDVSVDDVTPPSRVSCKP